MRSAGPAEKRGLCAVHFPPGVRIAADRTAFLRSGGRTGNKGLPPFRRGLRQRAWSSPPAPLTRFVLAAGVFLLPPHRAGGNVRRMYRGLSAVVCCVCGLCAARGGMWRTRGSRCCKDCGFPVTGFHSAGAKLEYRVWGLLFFFKRVLAAASDSRLPVRCRRHHAVFKVSNKLKAMYLSQQRFWLFCPE